MLCAISNPKGGQGKSLTAGTMAVALEATLLDLDPRQGDSLRFARKAGLQCRLIQAGEAKEVIEEAAGSDAWFVADCPPAESDAHRYAVFAADIVVVPLAADGAQDIRGWYRGSQLLAEAVHYRAAQGLGQIQVAFLNRTRRTAMTSAVANILQGWADPEEGRHYLGLVGQRVALAEAYAEGKGPHLAKGAGDLAAVISGVVALARAYSTHAVSAHHRSIQ